MKYKIEFAKGVEKQLLDIPRKDLVKISQRIEKLSENPLPLGHEKLGGRDEIYRARQGDYRILYSIYEKTVTVLVLKIGHRREVYR